MKLITTIFYFFLVTTTFAQNVATTASPTSHTLEPDQRLYEAYDAEYIDRLVTENPFLIKRWNFYLDNAFYIMDAIPGKTETHPEIIISDIDNLNILLLEKELGLTHDFQRSTIYNIKDSNKCLVYWPGKKFVKKLNKFLKQE